MKRLMINVEFPDDEKSDEFDLEIINDQLTGENLFEALNAIATNIITSSSPNYEVSKVILEHLKSGIDEDLKDYYGEE